MTTRLTRPAAAAILAGAAGLGLIVLGCWMMDWQIPAGWHRLSDPSWWIGSVLRGFGFLSIGRTGFKIALAVVAGAITLVAWLRRRSPE